MLKFDRKEFMAGVQIVKFMDKDMVPGPQVAGPKVPSADLLDDEGKPAMVDGPMVDGPMIEALVEKTMALKVADKGKNYSFMDEDAVLAKYPVLFKKV